MALLRPIPRQLHAMPGRLGPRRGLRLPTRGLGIETTPFVDQSFMPGGGGGYTAFAPAFSYQAPAPDGTATFMDLGPSVGPGGGGTTTKRLTSVATQTAPEQTPSDVPGTEETPAQLPPDWDMSDGSETMEMEDEGPSRALMIGGIVAAGVVLLGGGYLLLRRRRRR